MVFVVDESPTARAATRFSIFLSASSCVACVFMDSGAGNHFQAPSVSRHLSRVACHLLLADLCCCCRFVFFASSSQSQVAARRLNVGLLRVICETRTNARAGQREPQRYQHLSLVLVTYTSQTQIAGHLKSPHHAPARTCRACGISIKLKAMATLPAGALSQPVTLGSEFDIYIRNCGHGLKLRHGSGLDALQSNRRAVKTIWLQRSRRVSAAFPTTCWNSQISTILSTVCNCGVSAVGSHPMCWSRVFGKKLDVLHNSMTTERVY